MRDLAGGFGHLLAGQRWVFRNGRWLGFGLLPGLLTLVLYAGALIGLGYGADDLTAWATPFADGWGSPWLGLFRGFLTALVFCLGLFIAVITFTAVTLLIGQPFYESLSEQVDRSVGGEAPESGLPLARELWISARDSVKVLVRVLLYGIVLFALGFIPVVGQTVIPAIGFCVSGYFLTEELTAVALQRREVELKDRLALLRGRRAMVLGFGIPLVLAFLVPLVAVFLMPGAVAGATLMVRELRGEDEERAEGDGAEDSDGRTPQEHLGRPGHPAPPAPQQPSPYAGPYAAGPRHPAPQQNPYAQ
ncbi:EI24 domain-containing protein [Streptomyces flavotricini]|uniref:EI24 domain-containing protein n=1 Tax=Streptomyces flavotricini TaxID=66888 RepID=A0ABS8EDP5_9ACTN|nr:EI24 domain-containing protein [Streptomyces flavotricini]MCC0098324.1 EI24 domain-containing protein [Streptomyces flavotricini]